VRRDIARGSDMARNVQTEPKDGPQRQKEEAGAVVDRGKSRVCSARARRAVSRFLSSRKDAQAISGIELIKNDRRGLACFRDAFV
jgi:hypothetical protein